MKHEFKEGDCFVPSSVEKGNEFLKLAEEAGYYVYNYEFTSTEDRIEYWRCGDNTGFIACNITVPNYTEKEMFAFLSIEEPKGFVDSLGNPIKEGDMVYVSDISVQRTLADRSEHIFFTQRNNNHFTVLGDSTKNYRNNKIFSLTRWSYIVSVNSIPKEKKVKLNDDYTAVVTADTVKVGCQTFRKDVILDVVEALKSFE